MSEANEITDVSESSEEQAPSLEARIVEAAKEQGWREGGELDALDFIKRGSQFHKDLKHTVDELKEQNRKAYQVIAEHIHSQRKKEYQEQVGGIKENLRKAASEGDADKVLELSETLKKVPEPDPIQEDPKMEVIDKWTKENVWFNSNEEMRTDALGFYQAEKIRLGVDDPEKILPVVRKKMEKLHEDYFKPKNPNRERASGETGGKMKSASRGLSRDDLDDDERAHLDQFVALGLKEKDLLQSIQNLRRQRGQA